MKHSCCIGARQYQRNVYKVAANLAKGPVTITNHGKPMWVLQSATSNLSLSAADIVASNTAELSVTGNMIGQTHHHDK